MSTEFEEAIYQDLGRSHFVTELLEISSCKADAEWSLNNLDWMSKDYKVETEMALGPGTTIIRHEPLGVVGIYGSWNFPVVVCLKPLIQSITTGNAVLLKPSEVAPKSSAVLKKFCEQYLDPESIQCLEGGVEVAQKMNGLKLDLICFTGST